MKHPFTLTTTPTSYFPAFLQRALSTFNFAKALPGGEKCCTLSLHASRIWSKKHFWLHQTPLSTSVDVNNLRLLSTNLHIHHAVKLNNSHLPSFFYTDLAALHFHNHEQWFHCHSHNNHNFHGKASICRSEGYIHRVDNYSIDLTRLDSIGLH